MDLRVLATVLFPVEMYDDRFCCCDSLNCFDGEASLGSCYGAEEHCDYAVGILFPDCAKCPSACCLVYYVGSTQHISITDASFQIDGETADVVSCYMYM